MNFTGWVAIPRSIIENTYTGLLSNTEQLVLLTLMLLADAKTGSGYINAAAIRVYLPDLKYGTAKRVLKSLEDKRLIFRKIKPASNDLYPYWLHGYQISGGQHKMSFIDLSEVFTNQNVAAIRYVADVPAKAPAVMPAVALASVPAIGLASAPNNNKDKDTDTHTNNDPPLGSVGGESFGERNSERSRDSQSEANGDGVVRDECADGEPVDVAPLGLIFRNGEYFTELGTKVHPNALAVLLGKDGSE